MADKKDTLAIDACFDLVVHYFRKNQLDTAKLYALKASTLSEELNHTAGKVRSWRILTTLESKLGNYDESLAWSDKGLALIAEEGLAPVNSVDYLINRGAAHFEAGLVGKAAESYVEAIEIARKENLEQKRSLLLLNLGVFYRQMKRYEDALVIYEEAYKLKEAFKDSAGMANVLFNSGAVYSKLQDHENALNSIEAAKKLYKKLGKAEDVLLCDLSKGFALSELGNPGEAYRMLRPLSAQKQLPFEPSHKFLLFITLAKVSLQRNQPLEADGYLNRIQEELEASDFGTFKTEFYDVKSRLYAALGQYEKAYTYDRKFLVASNNDNELKKIELQKEMEEKYLSLEKDFEIDQLNAQNRITALELKTANFRNVVFATGLTIVGIISIFLFMLYRKIRQQNHIIQLANQQKETLLKEIHHRVKNNLQVISSLLSLQSRKIEDPTALQALNEGRNRVKSMALIHQNLYQDEDLVGVNVPTYITKLTQNLVNSYNINEEAVAVNMDIDDMELDVDTIIPIGLILNELISNSLKYAFEEGHSGKIEVRLKHKEQKLELGVEDNGKGLPTSFSLEQNETLGFKLIKTFADKLKAKLQVMGQGQGTHVQMIIPFPE